MTTLLYQVTLTAESSIPADICMNTWHTDSNSVDPADDAEGFTTLLFGFYNSLDEFWSPCLSGDAFVKVYDLEDVQPRVPIYEAESVGLFSPTGTPLPSECAVALSYRGVFTSGSAPARRRGRIFLGPFNTGAMSGTPVDGQAVVNTSLMNAIASGAESLMGSGSPSTWGWSVFSPTTAGAQPWDSADLLGATLPVVAGYVDNAFDTIRSRGPLATTRSSFPT